jgi:hypothetical protein
VEGPAGSSITAIRTVGGVVTEPGATSAIVAGVIDSGNAVEGGHFVATARNGQVVSGSASAEVGDAAGDCILSVTALGP